MIRCLSRAEQLAADPAVQRALAPLRAPRDEAQPRANLYSRIKPKPVARLTPHQLQEEVERLEQIAELLVRREKALATITEKKLGMPGGSAGKMGEIVAPLIAGIVDLVTLRSSRRDAYLVGVRWTAIGALHAAGFTVPAIAAYFNRDRGGITHALAQMKKAR